MQYLGVGVGLRREHFDEIFKSKRSPDWFEIVTENYMDFGGLPEEVLNKILKKFPVIPHGVSISLGALEPIDENYLFLLKKLLDHIDSPWFSDHLCLSSHGKIQYHDLIPVLKTDESIDVIVEKIKKIKEYTKRPFAIENISYYTESSFHTYDEVTFTNKILAKSDCLMLLDINNVFVNSKNLKFDPYEFINNLNLDRVVQIHMGGHWDRGDMLIDTHGDKICDEVWSLFEYTVKKIGRPVTTLIEWDNELPSYDELLNEADFARAIIYKHYGEKINESERVSETLA